MRRGLTSNGNGFPLNFNSVESVDIIKGPPDAVYGASQYVGGYVDEVTKQPYFDQFRGDIGTTIGEYQVYRWTADFGGPLIKDKLAFRISYSGEDSGSYYDYSYKQSEALYAALTWTPVSKYTLAFSGEFNEAAYLENNGINRVTQDLIDNDRYITGTVPGATTSIAELFNPVVAGPTVDIDHAVHIIGPTDGSYGKSWYAQTLQTLNVTDNFKILDNTLYERIDRHTYNSQEFDEVLKNNAAVDNRLEFILDNDFHVGRDAMKPAPKDAKDVAKDMAPASDGLTIHNEVNTGLEFRFQDNDNYDTYAYEPFDAFDITKPRSSVHIPLANLLAGFPGQYEIPGEDSKYVFTPNNGDSARSFLYEFGPYVQDNIKFGDKFSLFLGGRVDIIYVDAASPPGTPNALFLHSYTTQGLPSANISPTYKPFPWMTTYFTYNFSESTDTGDGGSYSPTFPAQSYHLTNRLYELGSKFSILKDKLYFTVTGYIQGRNEPSQGGTSVKQNVDGFEFEAYYQPDKHLYATASYSLLDSHTENPGFIHEVLPITTSSNVKPGTVLLTDAANFDLMGNYLTAGYPKHLLNGLVSYKFDFGLGATADIQITSPINVSYLGNVKIPWQYNVDFTVFYRYKNYEARVAVYDATDEHNWGPANPIYGNESIFAVEPIHVEGSFKIFF